MRLYLVRHTHAVTEEENPARPLSARGRTDAVRLAAFFRANHAFQPAQVWHSPLTRSFETARLLISGLALDPLMIETPGLLPEDDPHEIATRIDSLNLVNGLALVGHEPHLSALATLFLRGKPKPALFELKKGAVLVLEPTGTVHKNTGRPRWHACWHFTPDLLPVG
jgi:phosphohistidine phosphatase